MINYLSKFSAHLSELAEPIRELAKERVPFNWGPEHNEAFSLIKKEVTAAPILAYYNPKKLMVLQMDASCKGLGACLLQNEKPVYFACKALTETQKGYVAIELESLAVTWAMEKFHHFLYRNQFTLETDQKPLEAILSKKLKPGHTTTPKNSHQDISIQLQDKIYPRADQPNSRLPIQIRGSKRFNIFTQTSSEPNHKSTQGSK